LPSPDPTLLAINAKIDRLLAAENLRERRHRWAVTWGILKAVLFLVLPVGVGYYAWVTLETQLPLYLQSILGKLPLGTLKQDGSGLSPDLLHQLQGAFGNIGGL